MSDAPATTAISTVRGTGTRSPIYRLNTRQFKEMIDAGIFRETDHVELIGGLLFKNTDKMTKNDPRDSVVGQLAERLRRLLPSGFIVREEKSLELGPDSRLEPDLAVVRGAWADFRNRTPGAAEVALLIEVSDTTYAEDHGKKLRRYASAGILAYWIVRVRQQQIEIYTDPTGQGKPPGYQTRAVYTADQEVPVLIEGRELGRIPVKELLS